MAKCKDCTQGYTKDGFAAYPDHIELCPLHSATDGLLAALRITAVRLVNKMKDAGFAQEFISEAAAEADAAIAAAEKM